MRKFAFKPFEEMTEKDYEEIGFKSGLEIHQQLLTEKKLFCRCPAGIYDNDEYHAEILRHMRPTLSELGEYDGTALMEFKTRKEIIYRVNKKTVCTYEMDDTPPFEINEKALDIAIEIGLSLKANIVDELHISRKQYLDGSIPTGFQRTAIVSVGGEIPYKNRKIGIIQMSIEEDSCREFSDKGHTRIYLTDRLGMPLIETVTKPEMRTPQEVAEVNDILRRLVRGSRKVRTGIGAARQDVNVSVRGGTRIEIKGVSKIKLIPCLTYNEAMRQWNLLKLKDELAERGVTEKTFQSSNADVADILAETKFLPVSEALKSGKKVFGTALKNFAGLLNWQTQTDTYFWKEISDRVRVIACLDGKPNIAHSDDKNAEISAREWERIRERLAASEKDAIVLVWGDKSDVKTAVDEISARAKEATIGVPSETRQALKDGTTGFERILPGPDRMYPDTDLPPKPIETERVERIKKELKKPFWEYEEIYERKGVPRHLIRELADSIYNDLFVRLNENFGVEPKLLAVALTEYPKKLKKLGYDVSVLNEKTLEKIFEAFAKNKIVKDGIYAAMKTAARKGIFSEDDLPTPADEREVEKQAKEIVEKYKNAKLYDEKNRFKLVFGELMTRFRGKVDAKIAETITRKYLGEK